MTWPGRVDHPRRGCSRPHCPRCAVEARGLGRGRAPRLSIGSLGTARPGGIGGAPKTTRGTKPRSSGSPAREAFAPIDHWRSSLRTREGSQRIREDAHSPRSRNHPDGRSPALIARGAGTGAAPPRLGEDGGFGRGSSRKRLSCVFTFLLK